MEEFSIQQGFDAHVHFRGGDMLQNVVPETARQFCRALVMPNPKPPIRTLAQAEAYKDTILQAASKEPTFEPLMTFKILPDTTPEEVEQFMPDSGLRPGGRSRTCVVAGKVYPKDLTTHSEDGVYDYFALNPVFAAMAKLRLVSCLHGEMPDRRDATGRVTKKIRGLDREREFLRTLAFIASAHPNLRIVLEHITTAAAVEAVLALPHNVAATITLHHLFLTHDDVGGDRMCPNNFCKPVAKDFADREALIEAAISGSPKFFFGSDSAPHPKDDKQRLYDCCAGVYTAPVIMPLLVQLFEEQGALDRLHDFTFTFGMRFYDQGVLVSKPPRMLRLIKAPWAVPEEVGGVVPFMAGEQLLWQLVNED